MENRHITAKKAWGKMAERARLGHRFGFIAYLGLLYRSGTLSRDQVRDVLNDAGVTREELEAYRAHAGTETKEISGCNQSNLLAFNKNGPVLQCASDSLPNPTADAGGERAAEGIDRSGNSGGSGN